MTKLQSKTDGDKPVDRLHYGPVTKQVAGTVFDASSYADLIPRPDTESRAALKADIEKNGVLTQIVVSGKNILDGKTRYEIAIELDIPFPTVEYLGTDYVEEAIRPNIIRRNLTKSQLAMLASEFATRKRGKPSKSTILCINDSDDPPAEKQEEVSQKFGVSKSLLQDALKIRREADEEDLQKVRNGILTVNQVLKKIKTKSPKEKKDSSSEATRKKISASEMFTAFKKMVARVDQDDNDLPHALFDCIHLLLYDGGIRYGDQALAFVEPLKRFLVDNGWITAEDFKSTTQE